MSESFKSFVADLPNLTRLRSRESSTTLARVLTDLYVQDARHGTAEAIRFSTLMLGLMERVRGSDRRVVAEKLAERTDVSPVLMRVLAESAPEIAALLVRRSPQLDDAALLRLAEESEANRVAIAGRAGLTRRLVMRLMADGGLETFAALAANATLRWDPPLLARLVDRLRDIPAAARLFVERDDVDGADVAALFLAASTAGRRKILARLDAEAGQAPADPLVAALAADAGRVLFDHAAAGRRPEIAASLAKLLRLPAALAESIVADEGGEPLVVALKALRISERDILSILIHVDPTAGHSVPRLFALAELATSFGPATAERLAAAWRRDPARAEGEPRAPAERAHRDATRSRSLAEPTATLAPPASPAAKPASKA